MKKYFLFIILCFSILLVSCWNSNQETISTNNDVKKQEIGTIQDTKNTNLTDNLKKEDIKEENSWDTVEKLNSTMIEIFKRWKTATCTFKLTNEWSTFDSIMYIDWKKLRYTMSWDIAWNKMENNSIVKDGYSYSWSNLSKDWWKIKEDLSEDSNTWSEWSWEMEAEEMNQKLEFECKSWADSSKFDLPTDINFQDMWNIPQLPRWN